MASLGFSAASEGRRGHELPFCGRWKNWAHTPLCSHLLIPLPSMLGTFTHCKENFLLECLSSLGDDTQRSPSPAELMSSVLSLSCRPSVPFLLTALSHHIYIPCSQAQSWPAAHTGHVCPDAQPCSLAPQTSSFELPQCQFNGPRPLLFPVEKV